MTSGRSASNAVSEGINGLTPEWLDGVLSRSGALGGARVERAATQLVDHEAEELLK